MIGQQLEDKKLKKIFLSTSEDVAEGGMALMSRDVAFRLLNASRHFPHMPT